MDLGRRGGFEHDLRLGGGTARAALIMGSDPVIPFLDALGWILAFAAIGLVATVGLCVWSAWWVLRWLISL